MKKEWKKPFVKCIVLDVSDIIVTSLVGIPNKSADIDDGEYDNTTVTGHGDFRR